MNNVTVYTSNQIKYEPLSNMRVASGHERSGTFSLELLLRNYPDIPDRFSMAVLLDLKDLSEKKGSHHLDDVLNHVVLNLVKHGYPYQEVLTSLERLADRIRYEKIIEMQRSPMMYHALFSQEKKISDYFFHKKQRNNLFYIIFTLICVLVLIYISQIV